MLFTRLSLVNYNGTYFKPHLRHVYIFQDYLPLIHSKLVLVAALCCRLHLVGQVTFCHDMYVYG